MLQRSPTPNTQEGVSGATFSNAGGGFFPLQRLDRAQTAFLVMVSRVDLVRSLSKERSFSAAAPAAVYSPSGGD